MLTAGKFTQPAQIRPHGFRVLGGVPGRGIYDNMRTAVDRVGGGKERQVNIRFLAMANHYVFAPEFCNPAAGWEKGQVEKMFRIRGIVCGSQCRTCPTWRH